MGAGNSAVVSLTAAGLARGARLSLPFFASSVIYGVAFGLLALDDGLSAFEATLMSALVFSGSAQVPLIQNWASHPTVVAVFLTVVVANVRYLLMGAALRSWLAPLGPLRALIVLLPLVDGSFAIAIRERAKGNEDAGIMLGSCLISYSGWVVGTALGTVAGRLIANPRAIGLDFIIVAFCAAAASMLMRGRTDIAPAIVAIAAVILCEWLAPGPWTIVAAALGAAITAALQYAEPGDGLSTHADQMSGHAP